MLCPRCKQELTVTYNTNFDNNETYCYPDCLSCGWTTAEVFDNKAQIEEYLKIHLLTY
jgi:hypothetical protein